MPQKNIMDGIYYKDGIYLLVDDDTENEICIYHYSYRDSSQLYGGRVFIRYFSTSKQDEATLTVDGISIVRMEIDKIDSGLELNTIISHLNAIETNGVDAFLENYKKGIEIIYAELKEMKQNTEALLHSEKDESRISILFFKINELRRIMLSFLCILFSLFTRMTTGLENEKVNFTYQSVVDLLS